MKMVMNYILHNIGFIVSILSRYTDRRTLLLAVCSCFFLFGIRACTYLSHSWSLANLWFLMWYNVSRPLCHVSCSVCGCFLFVWLIDWLIDCCCCCCFPSLGNQMLEESMFHCLTPLHYFVCRGIFLKNTLINYSCMSTNLFTTIQNI